MMAIIKYLSRCVSQSQTRAASVANRNLHSHLISTAESDQIPYIQNNNLGLPHGLHTGCIY